MDDFDRTLMRATLAVTLVCIGVVAFWLITAATADEKSCELFNDAGIYGEPSISWFPPGLTCNYNNGAHIDSPQFIRVSVLFIAVIGLPFVWWLHRELNRDQSR